MATVPKFPQPEKKPPQTATSPAAKTLAADQIPGPVPGTRITEAYARLVARDAYFWAWPMMNIYNKRLAYSNAPSTGLMGGIVPVAPPHRLAMLSTT